MPPSKKKFSQSPLIGAAFLMATSAIGPGFLTQTANFTNTLLASFGFVILISILLDIGAQLNIWRILSASGLRAQELADKVIPGAGSMLMVLIVLGGLAFNAGNLAGAGLGLEVITGVNPKYGALLSGALALILFYQRNSLALIDSFSKWMGIIMIGLTLYVVFVSEPPLLEAGYRTFMPEKVDLKAIITLVGGTVGGYISFAGAHRLLDAGITGPEQTHKVNRSAISAILLASVMRILLFLAALGVITKGLTLDSTNPAASVFQLAIGWVGYKIFGIVMWCAAITSVVGSAYTSISFISSPLLSTPANKNKLLTAFVIVSLGIFILFNNPVQLLITAGALNGFILPISLLLVLLASYRKKIMGNYAHPQWLKIIGILVVIATLWLSIMTVIKLLE